MELPAFIALFAVVFPIIWLGVLYAISTIGPWATLAKAYPHDDSVMGVAHCYLNCWPYFLFKLSNRGFERRTSYNQDTHSVSAISSPIHAAPIGSDRSLNRPDAVHADCFVPHRR